MGVYEFSLENPPAPLDFLYYYKSSAHFERVVCVPFVRGRELCWSLLLSISFSLSEIIYFDSPRQKMKFTR